MAQAMAQDMTDTAAQSGSGHRRLRRIAHVPQPAHGPAWGRRAGVSVVIPSYNYGRYLEASVRSALEQRDVEPEVIVVDDASADYSVAIAERLAAADPRVRVIRHETNLGASATFNAGYAVATGEFIVRLDADDQLTPGSLARAVALFDAFPNVGLVYGHPVHFTAADPPAAREAVRSWSVWSGADWVAERCRRGTSCITSQEAIVRASVMEQVGGLSAEIAIATDLHLAEGGGGLRRGPGGRMRPGVSPAARS
jgi:cellulose synthase/poly-beta-1,6-N-acetylglucosamine synthase-like glycosyltransferase